MELAVKIKSKSLFTVIEDVDSTTWGGNLPPKPDKQIKKPEIL